MKILCTIVGNGKGRVTDGRGNELTRDQVLEMMALARERFELSKLLGIEAKEVLFEDLTPAPKPDDQRKGSR